MPSSDRNPHLKKNSAYLPGDRNYKKSSSEFTPVGGTSRETLVAGMVVARRFTLKRLIGRGGMGVVWEVHDKTLRRNVALKFLGAEIASDLEAVTDLQRETRRSLELTHPNIVRVYDYVEDNDFQLVGISMELLAGQSLQALKLQQAQWVFSPETVHPWLRQICAALDYAHINAGVVHRDLKPGNIFIDDRGSLKIVDFGVAMVVRESTSRFVQEARLSRSGTLTYMSPQQLKGSKPTSADDWYSIGALLYELFTSKPPFFRGDPQALLHQVMTDEPLPIAQRQAEMGITDIHVPPLWEKAIKACLAKEAAARPKSGAALLAILDEGALSHINKDTSAVASTLPVPWLDTDQTIMQVARLPTPGALSWFWRKPKRSEPALNATLGAASKSPASARAVRGPQERGKKPSRSVLLASTLIALLLFGSVFILLRYEPRKEVPPLPLALTPGLTLKVDPTESNAQVQIDDMLPILVPPNGRLLIRDLPDGDHIIFAQAPGFEPFKARTVLRQQHGELDIGLVSLRGSIEVTARPGSRVIIRQSDGSELVLGEIGSLGTTTFSERVRLGDTAMRLEHPDCLPTEIHHFSVIGGQTTRVRADQKIVSASLSVIAEPTGAEILVDGQSQGKQPGELNDLNAEAELQIEARLDGYQARRQSVTLKPREHRELILRLQPIVGDLVVSARPGTRVIAHRASQAEVELGSVGLSGEEKFFGILPQGHWTLSFDNADCQPTSVIEAEIAQGSPAYAAAKQLPLPGSLDIRSEPAGVEVWIQGVKQGTTPAVIQALPAEIPLPIELRLRGRTPLSRTITLRPHERSTLFFDKFNPEYVYARIDVQPWEKLRGHKITFSVDGSPVAPRSSLGSIAEMRFEAGAEHLLTIQAEGFRERSITIDPGDYRLNRITLEALHAQLLVTSDPTGALVWLNGVGPKETPNTFSELAPGRYTLQIQKQGYSPRAWDLAVGAGENIKLGPLSLSPSPPRPPVVAESAPPRAAISTLESLPPEAEFAGAVKLSGRTSLDHILNIVHSIALARGWSLMKSANNTVKLNQKQGDIDATLYLRCESQGIEIRSESYRAGAFGRLKLIPANWLRELQSDLKSQLY